MRGQTRLVGFTVAATVAGYLAAVVPAASASPAVGVPGTLSHFDLARKDCLGTAPDSTSKIWYTVAGGVLSDVYAPTIDTTNVETMQYLVTDGASFTDLQTRDMTYAVSADATGMICTVTSTAKSGAYRLTTTYSTDPARSSVVVHSRYTPLKPAAASYRLYVRLDATVAGNGGGGAGNGGADNAVVDTTTGSAVPVSYDTVTTTSAANRDYAVPSFLALRADRPFGAVSSGFVGTPSDGLTQLDSAHALTPTDTAMGGNVEQTAAVSRGKHGDFTLALGFGTTQAAAVSTAGATVRTPVGALRGRYAAGWRSYDARLRRPSSHLPGLSRAQQEAAVRQYYLSANVVKASEDKTFPGAIVASLASPWGQAVSAGDPANTYFGSYREVFSRDLYEAWTALLTDGDLATAQAATRFLLERQQLPDGSLPRNSLVNGKTAPDSFNTQLDEVAYPLLMVLQSGLAKDTKLWPHVQAAADYVIAHGPSFGPERWEEQSGYSPSTIAAEIAGLVAAARIARKHHSPADARVWLATADRYQRSVKGWAVTTNGPLSSRPYFIRLSKTGDPNAAISYNVGNGGPTLDQRAVIDAGFLELVRLGELSATDPDVANSLTVVDRTIRNQTNSGVGWLRYNGDGYGDCHVLPDHTCPTEGRPWAPSNQGTGHIWPVLSAERGEQDLATGRSSDAARLLAAIDAMSSGVGLVPEQVWDAPDVAASPYGTDPTQASIGFVNGKPDGSAAPLTWGAAAQVRLVADLTARRVLEQPAATVDRYLRHTQKATTLTVTSPPDQTAATDPIHVVGTAVPGAVVDVADVAGTTTHATATVGASGAFSFDIPAQAGDNVLVVTSTAPDGGTAQAVRTVVNDVVEGTLLLDTNDPTGDDNGPGNYAYPTAGDFHAGAYDMTDFQVYDTGPTVTFRVQTRDLTPTFGSPLGAQLVDVYVHQPGASATSTAASFPQRNYTIASSDAWSRLIEVQGFGQRFVDASNTNTVGSVTISANRISRYITFSVPKAALGGSPASGWAFTVVLTGQDGFSPDQARGFQRTPQDYQFGVCATISSDPHCTVDPSTVPKAMDVLTPSGVSQADELDYTLHTPVVLRGVAIP
ncbi:glucodextranase DOMON-like domain-containing protein [Nocardioides sp. CER19]|uniref:glucodextranase DOMON-like domain-containing protein n=1 Tax=Nocardioides sp. CER19 TaxID=3038538 RepID=UPI00244BE311|nr:glucodextranase DOMON-like domain-containing protein [Nocardioides sp. CER19]MDH2415621.1 glucodextranase DOMON-like domain-containing protein [Nocardioides sp. CER19]